MELLDRYLQAVQKHLPWKRQEDIVAELRANLEAQLEDKEAELGRELTNAEAEAWLKQLGSPQKMAARYQPQQYLIGPQIFPTYWIVLKMVMSWTLFIYAIVSVIGIFSVAYPSGGSVLDAVLKVPGVLVTAAVWVTLIFVIFELASAHFPKLAGLRTLDSIDWEPSKLPALQKVDTDGGKPQSFSSAVAGVIFGYLFLIWLLLLPRHMYLVLGPGAYFLHLDRVLFSPVLLVVYWSIIVLNGLQLLWNTIQLWRGRWQRSMRLERVLWTLLGFIPIGLTLSVPGHLYLWLRNPAVDQAQYGALVSLCNVWFYRSALIVCAFSVLMLLSGVVQLTLDHYRKRSIAMD